MRIDLLTLAAVVTASAIHMALFTHRPVNALAVAPLFMTLFFTIRIVLNGSPRGLMLIARCAAIAFTWMMIFIAGTMISHAAYYSITDRWPKDEGLIDMPTAILLIVTMYGGAAAIVGACIGLVASGFVRWRAGRLRIENGG